MRKLTVLIAASALQSPIAGRLAWIKIVRVTNARFAVGGLAGRVAGKAVAVRIKLVDDDSGASVVVAHTAHAVAVGGRWRWILPAQRIGLYGSSACTAEAPPGGPLVGRYSLVTRTGRVCVARQSLAQSAPSPRRSASQPA